MTCKRVDTKHLLTALWSLTQQTLQDFELVAVVADTDTCEFIEDFCLENDIIRNVTWEYAAKTRSERFKVGVEACRGQWIAVLDSDDVLHPDALWTTYRCLQKFPIMNYFCGSHHLFDTFDGMRSKNPALPLAQSIKSLIHSFKQRHFWGFRNEPSRWPPQMFYTKYPVEDFWIFATLAMNGVPILHIPHYLYAWRVHPYQWTQFERPLCMDMSRKIADELRKFSAKQNAMWHWGDMALAMRLNSAMVRLEEEVLIGEDLVR